MSQVECEHLTSKFNISRMCVFVCVCLCVWVCEIGQLHAVQIVLGFNNICDEHLQKYHYGSVIIDEVPLLQHALYIKVCLGLYKDSGSCSYSTLFAQAYKINHFH